MNILSWSDDYLTGFAEIDERKALLFQLVNDFPESDDGTVSDEVISGFIDELLVFSTNDLLLEEQYMKKNKYPLLKYHKQAHDNLRNTADSIKEQCTSGNSETLYGNVINFVSGWLNDHIAHDDLTYAKYCKNRDVYMNKEFSGRKCKVFTIGNVLLFNGTIKSVKNSHVTVKPAKEKNTSVMINDELKISFTVGDRYEQVFFSATVYHSDPKTLKMINPEIILEENKRNYFRVTTDITASVHHHDTNLPVKILDMSSGGMRFESDQDFIAGETVPISLNIDENKIMILFKIVRVTSNENANNIYGTEFYYMNHHDSEVLNAYILHKQLHDKH